MSFAKVGNLLILTCDGCLVASTRIRIDPALSIDQNERRLLGVAGTSGWSAKRNDRDSCPACRAAQRALSREAREHRRRAHA